MLFRSSTDNATWTVITANTNSAVPATVQSGLTNGTQYWFRISVVTAGGNGVAANPVAVTPYTVPTAPVSLVASPRDGEIGFTWSAPVSDGGATITDYQVETSTDGGASWTATIPTTGGATAATITGLTNGVAYAFRIAALNAAGTGAASTWVTSSPVAPPVAPRSVEATASEETVAALQWTPPTDDGGAAVVGYKVQTSTDGGTTWTDTAQLGPNVFDAGVQTASMSTVIVTSSRVVTLGRGSVRYMLVDDAGLNN